MYFLQICSVGWEPNPGHTSYLLELESYYRACGYRVTINTNTGVGVRNKQGQFARLKQVRQSDSASHNVLHTILSTEYSLQDPLVLKEWPMELPSRFVNDEQVQVIFLFCRFL